MEARDAPPWTPLERVAFRFSFAYLLLYFPILPVSLLPGFGWVDDLWNGGWSLVVPWFARHVFGIARGFPDMTDGLVDVRYSYARLGCVALFAVAATLAWSVLDRRRTDYARLAEWLRVLVRYGLASAMLRYGVAKVLKQQFASPSLEQLLEPYGDLAPRQLLWTFMGYSTGYTLFTGAAECLGGILVLFRRTTTLGALVIAAVMANVVMLNLSYDVPVKLFATHLLLMAIFLAAPDLGRLGRLLVLGREAQLASSPPHFAATWAKRAGAIAKVSFVAYLLLARLFDGTREWRSSGDAAAAPALYGIWEVETFSRDGVPITLSARDAAAWRRLVIDRTDGGVSRSSVTLWRGDETREHMRGDDDAAARTLVLESNAAPSLRLVYTRPGPDLLALDGTLEGRVVHVDLRRRNERDLRLLARGFRWSRGDSMLRD